MTDVATFIATLELPDGRGLELEPFQARMLEALDEFPSTLVGRHELELAARRVEKRDRIASAIVVALLAGEDAKVALCGDELQARLTMERVAHKLQRYADLFGVELPAPAAELIHITRR